MCLQAVRQPYDGPRRPGWSDLEADILDTIAQADRRLRRGGSTRALGIARERLSRQYLATKEESHRYGPVEQAQMVASLRGWLGDLTEQLRRDFVRGEPEAQRTRRASARIKTGLRVRIRQFGPGLPGFPEGELATVERVVAGRRARVITDGGRRWSLSLDDLEVVDEAS